MLCDIIKDLDYVILTVIWSVENLTELWICSFVHLNKGATLRVLRCSNLPDSDEGYATMNCKQGPFQVFEGLGESFCLTYLTPNLWKLFYRFILVSGTQYRACIDSWLCVQRLWAATIACGISEVLSGGNYCDYEERASSSYLGGKTILGASFICSSLLSYPANHGRICL